MHNWGEILLIIVTNDEHTKPFLYTLKEAYSTSTKCTISYVYNVSIICKYNTVDVHVHIHYWQAGAYHLINGYYCVMTCGRRERMNVQNSMTHKHCTVLKQDGIGGILEEE